MARQWVKATVCVGTASVNVVLVVDEDDEQHVLHARALRVARRKCGGSLPFGATSVLIVSREYEEGEPYDRERMLAGVREVMRRAGDALEADHD